MKTTAILLFLASAFSCAAPPSSQFLDLTMGTESVFPIEGKLLASGSNLHYRGDSSVGLKEDLESRLVTFRESIEKSSMEGFHPNISLGQGDYLGYSYVKEGIGQAGVSVWVLVLGDGEISLNFSQEERSGEWSITKYESNEIGPDAQVYHFQGVKTKAQGWEEDILHLNLEAVGGRRMRLDI